MILIADSGSTKTDWCLVQDQVIVQRIQTIGLNPFFVSPSKMAAQISEHLSLQLPLASLRAIYFYGAGCAFAEQIESVRQVLQRTLSPTAHIEVASDMLGAARALCARTEGIACILGTGSNSCLYDGTHIVANVSPLGYILGDEGSGAVLGKLLLGSLLKNQLGDSLKAQFFAHTGLTQPQIIESVYRKPFPNRFLASLMPFFREHLALPQVRAIVLGSFEDFFVRNVKQYGRPDLPVHFVGSIATHFPSLLQEAAHNQAIQLGTICQRPIELLAKFH